MLRKGKPFRIQCVQEEFEDTKIGGVLRCSGRVSSSGSNVFKKSLKILKSGVYSGAPEG